MPTLWLFDIEPHEQRYTGEWQQYLPQQIKTAMDDQPSWKWQLQAIEGIETSGKTTKGAFLTVHRRLASRRDPSPIHVRLARSRSEH